MRVDERLFAIADEIASVHLRPGWFESVTSIAIRKIKLRQAIYDALVSQKEEADG